MASTTTTNAKPTTYVYGSGKDLSNAQSVFTPNAGYKLVDVSVPNFDTSTMKKGGIMLGGNGVNKNVTDSMINNLGISRISGLNANDTMEKAQQYKVNSLMPTNNQFSFDGDMDTYLSQAQDMLKPQYQLNMNQINKNYDENVIPGINNDTLSRGLARSSYAGNRVDQAESARQDALANLSMQQQQAVNNMAMQTYDKAYDRAYQQNNDQFNRGMSLYNSANQDLWQNKNFNADQTYKAQQQNNWQKQYDTSNSQWQKQYDTSNSQWQKTFDFNKTNADREYQLNLQQMAQAAAKAASKKSSSSSKSNYGGLTKTQTKDRYSQAFDEAIANMDVTKAGKMVYDDKQNIINDLGYSYWKSLEKKYVDWQEIK